MFDYFNLITREYHLALDKFNGMMDYKEELVNEQKAIEKQIEDEDMAQPVPEGLTREISEQLLKEKEEAMMKIYQQLTQIQF